jgi:hypothetical protein
MWKRLFVTFVDPDMAEVDPGSGERGGAGRFTLKFTVNFKSFFQLKKIRVQFQRFFANKTGRAPLPRLLTERSKRNIPCCALLVRQVRATFASDSRM